MGEWIPEPLPERTEWITGRPGGTTVDPADRGDAVSWLLRQPASARPSNMVTHHCSFGMTYGTWTWRGR